MDLPCRGFKNKAYRIYLFLFVAVATFGANLAVAQDTNDRSVADLAKLSLEQLLSYEVTAPTKSATRLTDTPGSVSVITYDQIRNAGATTIPELLRKIPGVNVRWNSMVQTIQARSFGSNPFTSSVLLLIDGIPYNSWNKGGFPQHPGFDFFNLENVKHIEVIRGAGSALYGENALNGVINIVTLSGEEYRQTRASVLVGSDQLQMTTVSHGAELGESGSFFVSVRSDQGQLPTELWKDSDAEASGTDLFFKAKYKGIRFSYYRRADEFDGFRENIIQPDFDFASVEEIEQDVEIAALNFSHSTGDGLWDIQANVSRSAREGTACGGCHARGQSADFEDKLDHGYQLFGNAQFNFNGIQGHKIMFGAERRDISAEDTFKSVPGQHTSAPTAYDKNAYFLQDRFALSKRVEVYAGLRYDERTSPRLFGNELFPRLAIVARMNDKLTLRGGWSEAARYPTFTELYQNTWFLRARNSAGVMVGPMPDFRPNPNLKPEKLSSAELGLEYRLASNASLKIDSYRNKHKNPLVLVYGADIGFENHGNEVIVQGAELEVRYDPASEWSSYANWSYQDNDQSGSFVDSAGLPVEFSYSPRHKVNAGLTYSSHEAFAATLEFRWMDSIKAPAFWSDIVFGSPVAVRLASRTEFNARVRYRLPVKMMGADQPLSISFAAKNLLNETDPETLVGVLSEGPGRSFVLKLDYEWAN